jgi:hypothetical protein
LPTVQMTILILQYEIFFSKSNFIYKVAVT